jgi:hypothetical protein
MWEEMCDEKWAQQAAPLQNKNRAANIYLSISTAP